jgi:hypothetical protein
MNKSVSKILLFFLLLLSLNSYTQSESIKITANYNNLSTSVILEDIRNKYATPIFYKPADLPLGNKSVNWKDKPLTEAIKELVLGSGLSVVEYGNAYFLIFETTSETAPRDVINEEILKSQTLADFSGKTIKLQGSTSSTSKNTLNAVVRDVLTKEEIIGAAISVNGKVRTVTDTDGKFFLNLNKGMNALQISYLGYKPLSINFDITGEVEYTIRIEKESQVLDEVVISGTGAGSALKETQTGINRVDIKALEKIPTFLGERDVIKAVLLNPGVSSVGEGASGFNVRGGNVDQNLVMQDEAILFNSSHALGFFSTFNADMIKTATLHKGAFNAQYGGRLSSVLEVQTKENVDKFRLKANINVLSTTGTAEIPIFKGSNIILSGRTTYSDLIFKVFKQPDIKNSSAGFYDLNGKINIKAGKSTLSLSGYYSADDFIYNNEFGFDYSTKIAQASLRTLFNDNVTNKLSFVWSDYISNQSDFDSQLASVFSSKIKYIRGHNKLSFKIGKVLTDAGVSTTLYDVLPGEFRPLNLTSLRQSEKLELEKGIESAAYISSDIKLNDWMEVLLGARVNHFAAKGPKTTFQYKDNVISEENIIGSEIRDGTLKTYLYPELRSSIKINLSSVVAFKAGFGQTSQYLNQVFNSDVPTPSSQWQLVNQIFEPGRSDNYSAGMFFGSQNNTWEISVEAYQRNLKNIYDYKDYADLFVNPHIETELLKGTGQSRGVEFSMKKNKGVLNGFVSYTYSETKYKVSGINKGEPYFTNFDQPHNVSLVLNIQPIEKTTFTANFTYRSGRPTTAPVSSFVTFDGVYVPIYSERNALRIPDTHRLDLSANFGKTHNKAAKIKTSWTFTIYNVYARKNPFSVFYSRSSRDVPTPQANRLAVIGTIFPSLSFNIEFE